jgi:hypothetical protein
LPRTNKAAGPQAREKRLEVIRVRGVRVVVVDYSHCSREGAWEITNQFDKWIRAQKPNSVNVLFDVNKPYYEPAHVNHWKKSLGRYDTYIRKSCFINASPFFNMLLPALRSFAAIVGVPMKKERGLFFKDKEAALQWLSEP